MNLDNFKNKTAKILLDIKAINIQPKKPFKLTSGRLSPVYVDCRKIISHLKERRAIINMGSKLIKKKVKVGDKIKLLWMGILIWMSYCRES